jgi:hypothetical protein
LLKFHEIPLLQPLLKEYVQPDPSRNFKAESNMEMQDKNHLSTAFLGASRGYTLVFPKWLWSFIHR